MRFALVAGVVAGFAIAALRAGKPWADVLELSGVIVGAATILFLISLPLVRMMASVAPASSEPTAPGEPVPSQPLAPGQLAAPGEPAAPNERTASARASSRVQLVYLAVCGAGGLLVGFYLGTLL